MSECDDNNKPPCSTGCVINSLVGGDHAYCSCYCHGDSRPAIPPSRKRQPIENQDTGTMIYYPDTKVS